MKIKLPCPIPPILSPFRYFNLIALCFALITPVALPAQQSDFELMLQAVEATTPHPAADAPEAGTFYTIQRAEDWAPLPADTMNLPFWDLGDGFYLLDDRDVDYAAWEADAAEAAAAEAEATGGGMMSMASANNSSSYYGSPVYLINMTASTAGDGSTVASFGIIGGTNFVPLDILMATNIADSVSQWTWLGIGYTSNRYTFSNQPIDQAFYMLAKPQKTTVVVWGDDSSNQCNVPFGLSNAVTVAGGYGQSLALLSDGTVAAWGQDDSGQGSVPTNLVGVAMIAAGWNHNVALLTNGTVVAWGKNNFGQTNVPTDLTNAIVISAQALHSLALTSNGTVVAWGDNGFGETNVPSGLSNVVAIAAGYRHNLAVTTNGDGTVVAWGYNASGQTNVPVGLSNVVDVAAGTAHSVALKNDGTVIAWGGNSHGETNVPAGLSNVVAIAAGGNPTNDTAYTVALQSDGLVVAWGNGEALNPVNGLSNVISIGAGADYILAVRTGPATPVITLAPTDQYQIAGGNVTFTSRGAGLYDVTYQWQTNGVNITGATNATLSLTNVQTAQVGVYNVVVSNEVSSLTSSNANFTLVTPPMIISQTPLPTNQVAIFGEYLFLSVEVTAPGQFNGFPLNYQWQVNGTNSIGYFNNDFVIGNPANVGTHSVTVTNAAGSASAAWEVTMTYAGSYVDVGTLAYHLATNAVAHTNGYTPANNMLEVSGWTYADYYPTNLHFLTNAVWSTNFWLQGAQGLSATAIGFLNGRGGQTLVTMVSPRHYLVATHTTNHFFAAFLDTNNVIYWRTNLQWVDVGNDTSVGILDADLPSSVGYLPVVPTNLPSYLPTNNLNVVQGIGMNQDMKLFSQPMTFGLPNPLLVYWNPIDAVPFGLGTNWNVFIRPGDSSDPEMFLISNQLVLVTHNFNVGNGPNYTYQIDTINQKMHYLSTNNIVGTNDYQLTQFSLTNWPTIH